jgi:hypothetical protein
MISIRHKIRGIGSNVVHSTWNMLGDAVVEQFDIAIAYQTWIANHRMASHPTTMEEPAPWATTGMN